MAIENFKSTQMLSSGNAMQPSFEEHAKLRFAFFDVVPTVTGDADSTADLCKLPHGRVRVMPHMSRVYGGIFGASRTLDIGHRAYTKEGNLIEAENFDAFATNLDVSAATANLAFATTMKYDIASRKEVTVAARIQGGTWPSGIALRGYVAYLVE